jgi:hypothetical protein
VRIDDLDRAIDAIAGHRPRHPARHHRDRAGGLWGKPEQPRTTSTTEAANSG